MVNELKNEKLLEYFNDQNFNQNLVKKMRERHFLNKYILSLENSVSMEKRF